MPLPRWSRRLLVVSGLTLTGLAVGTTAGAVRTWLNSTEVFRIRQLTVRGNYCVGTQDIIARTGVAMAAPIFAVDLGRLEDSLQTHPYIAGASIRRDLPATLEITVQERRLLAYVAGTPLRALDRDGRLLPEPPLARVYDLPIITGLNAAGPDTALRPRLQRLAALLRRTQDPEIGLYARLSEIASGESEEVRLLLRAPAITVRLPDPQAAARLPDLVAFLSYWRTAGPGRTLQAVDLRFDEQIVTRESAAATGAALRAVPAADAPGGPSAKPVRAVWHTKT